MKRETTTFLTESQRATFDRERRSTKRISTCLHTGQVSVFQDFIYATGNFCQKSYQPLLIPKSLPVDGVVTYCHITTGR